MSESDRIIGRLAEGQLGVVALRKLVPLGVTRRQVHSRVASRHLHAVHPGVFVVAGTAGTFAQRMMAATLAAGEGAVASHRGVAGLWGFPGVPRWPELSIPHRRECGLEGVTVFRTRSISPEDRGAAQGVPVLAPGRTLVDLAASYDERRLGSLLDYCLVRRLVSHAEMERRVAMPAQGRAGLGKIHSLLAARPASARPPDSDMEPILFDVLRRAGLPLPQMQVKVILPDGQVRYIDLAYPRPRLALEAKGFVWHASRSDWEQDQVREQDLVALGRSILPVTYSLIMFEHLRLANLVRAGLAARA